MKFKVASILELVIPLSILVVLSLSACGGGAAGAYGNGARPYDGTWNINYIGYALPAGTGVYCNAQVPSPTITISHGFGSATQINDCYNTTANPTGAYNLIWDISVTLDVTGAVSSVVNGGYITGKCINQNSCQAGGTGGAVNMTR